MWYQERWGRTASEKEISDWLGTGKSSAEIKAGILGHQAPVAGYIKGGSLFNTVEWIGRSNRQLWRTNVYGRGGFLNSSGVCPFDTTVSLPDNPYAGTHRIEWPNVKFPADGHYNIRIAVDDSVNLYIGDQVKIFKKGFVGDSDTPTREYNKGHFIKKGTYTLIADLYQKPGGSYGFGSGYVTAGAVTGGMLIFLIMD